MTNEQFRLYNSLNMMNDLLMILKKHSFFPLIPAGIIIALLCMSPSSFSEEKHADRGKKQQRSISPAVTSARQVLKPLARDPYVGAIVIDAATGNVLFQDNADVKGYPASVVKLMNLLVIFEAVEAGSISVTDRVTITEEAEKMGGSQVYLKKGEVHTVDDLLYAMIVQSANDAATALAIYYAGSKEKFVDLMNRRARLLGMEDTVFHSVHGLPPGRGQMPDVTTARDITKLSQEVLRHPEALRYTATRQRSFRAEASFIMRNRNRLVGTFEGCDGLKTGYFRAAGFSIAATAKRDEGRVIAVILGSSSREGRDSMARKLLSRSFKDLAATSLSPSAYIAPAYSDEYVQ